MKLDRNKPFGTVYGGGDHTYEQGGNYFDHEGELVGQEDTKSADAPKRMGRPPKVKDDISSEDSQLNAQLGT